MRKVNYKMRINIADKMRMRTVNRIIMRMRTVNRIITMSETDQILKMSTVDRMRRTAVNVSRRLATPE